MRDACLNAVNSEMQRAYGRDATPAEIREIETAIPRHMRLLAREDRTAWAGKTEEERYAEAGTAAAEETISEAQRKVRNLATRILRMDALTNFMDAQIAEGRDQYRLDAFSRIEAAKADAGGAPDGGTVDGRANGMASAAIAELRDVFSAGKRRGLWQIIPWNEPGTNSMLRRALAGVTDGVPPEFVRMAKLAHEHIEVLRARFNAAGGAIGRLEDWGEPHHWSDVRILRAVKQRGREAVVSDFTDAARRDKYVREDGAPMTRDEIHAFMDNALDTIITDGASKRIADNVILGGRGETANRLRAHREIHLRPEMVEPMLGKYSEMGAMESLIGHIRALTRDIALIETFGPNAELTAEQMINRAFDEDMCAFPELRNNRISASNVAPYFKYELGHVAKRNQALNLFNHLAGNARGERNAIATSSMLARSLATFKALGFTVWSSLTDPIIMQHVARARGLKAGRLWINDVAMFTNNGRRWAKRAGLITDTVLGYADRFNSDYVSARDLAAGAASFTMKITGLNWVTEARRAAYGMTLMDAFGHLVRHNESIAALKNADDQALVRLLNVNENTWAVWRMARLESLGANHTVLSPQAIAAIPDGELLARFPGEDPQLVKNRAMTQLLGIVKDETNTAVITPGARERSQMLGDETKSGSGTFGGELRRAVGLFRSFPWTYMMRQYALAKSIDGGGNRLAYQASLFVSVSLMGVMINWIYDLLNGRDPGAVDLSPEGKRNIIKGMMRGGGFAMLQDFLSSNADPNNRSQSLTSTLAGAQFSDIDRLQNLTLGNLNQAASGQETDFGPEAVRYVQSWTPNWYFTKLAMDRYIFSALQEEMSPGVNERRARAQLRTSGTTYYWQPGESEPDRLPDWRRAFEGDMPEPRHRRPH